MSWACYIERDLRDHKKKVFIIHDAPGNVSALTELTEVSYKSIKEGEEMAPALKDSYESIDGILQAIVDEAWEDGIRPRQIEDLGGELKATKYHLSDMRNLVKGL